jgi:catechol 2,3-dioxygenase-like lactoylglutathione lyase family enzyme
MRSLILGFIAIVFLISCNSDSEQEAGEKQKLTDFEFLLGTWHSALDFPANSYESWEKVDDYKFEGKAWSVNRLGDTTITEELELYATSEGIYYKVHILGEKSKIDTFTYDGQAEAFTFYDPQNDFPSSIRYNPHDYGIQVILSGSGENQEMELAFMDPSDPDAKKIDGLGAYVQVALGVSDWESEVDFFQELGFRVLDEMMEPYPFATLTDGTIILSIANDGMEYMGLAYIDKNMPIKADELKDRGWNFVMGDTFESGDFDFGVIEDPDSVGLAMITINPAFLPSANIRSKGPLGKFGEFTVVVSDLEESIEWYESVGFELNGKYASPYLWAILTDGKMLLGLHQTNEPWYNQVAITYFSMEAKSIIEDLQAKGIEVTLPEEWASMGPVNGIIKSPNNNQVNIFFGAL